MTAGISTSFLFLKRDERWKAEKPYTVTYQPPEGLSKNNFSLERTHNIRVQDVRESERQPCIQEHGFALINIESGPLECEDYDDQMKVASQFLPLAGNAVELALNASRVQFFDITVSSN